MLGGYEDRYESDIGDGISQFTAEESMPEASSSQSNVEIPHLICPNDSGTSADSEGDQNDSNQNIEDDDNAREYMSDANVGNTTVEVTSLEHIPCEVSSQNMTALFLYSLSCTYMLQGKNSPIEG